MSVTIILPAYNEARHIGAVLQDLHAFLQERHIAAEVIVVDDGSGDNTAQQAQNVGGVRVIIHPRNKGYGAALKTGVRAAKSEWVITYDADGQHKPEHIALLLPHLQENVDMVVGKREGYKGPWIRQPGKWLISKVANYLTEQHIPDLNSGLRAFRRSAFLQYEHLFPNGFSLSTTSTVCFFKEGLGVQYVPITIQARTGKSTVRPRDAVKTLMLVFRLTMLFSPLRIFLPTSIVVGCITVALFIYELAVNQNVSDAGVALLTFTGILFFFGLLADQVAALRREIGKRSS
ncbi:MAG: glycosyltransferase family 2 protein [Candidatus Peribacteraceae bacterium]|jgi:glycosyltransferase involved in cell wall biosynthesis